MTDWKRRRLVQAGISLPLFGLASARAQDRNLLATERKAAAPIASGASLLIAPRHALVIGNSSYGFSPLKNPANDAKALGGELKSAGFEVTVGLDLTRKDMLDAIRAYGESLSRTKAIGVFYFAGHGLQLAWRNYLVPTDATIARVEDIQARCVDVNAVIEGIAKAVNPMNVVILDACRENPFGGEVKLDQKGLSQLDAPPGTILAYATAPGNLASDGEGANGLYTEQLLREMKVPEAKIEDVFKRVRLTVRRRSNGQQIPWESTSLEEDFWFIPPKEIQRLAAAEAERARQEKEAARLLQERIEKAQREEAERLRRQAEAERARQEAEEKKRHEQLARIYKEEQERRRKQEESERAYEEELRFWERVSGAKEPGPVEEYLRRYPSGRFAEIAQAQLDATLAQMGEQRIRIAQQAQNPYTQGTAHADVAYKVGDRYSFQAMDIYSRVVSREMHQRVSGVTPGEVIYGDGRLVTDLLGNVKRNPEGGVFTANQQNPAEFFVGKRWRTRFSLEDKRGPARFDVSYRITKKERIVVPAGTFDAFRVEGEGSLSRDRVIQFVQRTWFAPEQCRRAVAREEIRIGGRGREGRAERFELTSFQQS